MVSFFSSNTSSGGRLGDIGERIIGTREGPLFQMGSLQMRSLARKTVVNISRPSFTTSKFIKSGDSLLEPLLTGYPKLVPILHNISQHRPS